MEKKIFSKDLGIDLATKKEEELFKWFLACLLFGKPIQQEVAKRTYYEFIKEGLTSPDKILDAGRDKIVRVLDQGHYVRFDYSTATKLLEASKELKDNYRTVTNLIKSAGDKKDLEKKLEEFKGIGPVTAKIFLRDIPVVWKNA